MTKPFKFQTSGIILLAFICSVNMVYSQDSENSPKDFEAWTSLGLEYKLNKRWMASIEEQLRLKENSSTIDVYFTQLTLDFESKSNFGIGGGFRYLSKHDSKGQIQGYNSLYRFHFDASYKHKVEDFSFKYRVRYQNKNDFKKSREPDATAKQTFRFRTSLAYNIKNWKFDPKISGELFKPLKNSEIQGLSKFRLSLGTSYKLKKVGNFDFFYRLEKEVDKNVAAARITHILGLGYTHSLKN